LTSLTTERSTELRYGLAEVCAAAGLDPDGAELLKYTMNAVYRLRADPVVVRLQAGPVTADRGERLVATARWLGEHDAPVTRLAPGIEQPVLAGPFAATFWIALPTPSHELAGGDLAAPIAALHALPAPGWMPEWDPFGTARRWMDASDGGLPAVDLAWLRETWDESEAAYRDLAPTLPHGFIHGDAHTGNLLRDESGRPVLADLDTAVRGPLAWDYVPTAVSMRFGRYDRHESLVAAIGYDVTASAAWPVLRRIRELLMVSGVLPDLRRRPEVAAELAHRLRTLRNDDNSPTWTRYA
jgi:aminoglycoside phosphotransferase (APT) family kinase protein